MKKKVLLTGGGGYIGVVLLKKLLAKGYKVRLLDNFLFGVDVIKSYIKKIEIVKKDIRKISKKDLIGIDAVIHLAGLSNDPMANFNPDVNFQINSQAAGKLARICKKVGIKRFTFASSASIYDKGLGAPVLIQNENSTVSPKAAYSSSKHQAETILLDLADNSFCPVIFRTGTVYGFSPRMRYDLVVNTMVKTALSQRKINVFCGGVQWRPLVDINDVVEAHILGITAPIKKVGGQIFNLVYKNYQMKELAEIIKKVLRNLTIETKIFINHSPRKDRSYRIFGDKIKQVLGWRPTISVQKSIEDMIKKIKESDYEDFDNPRYYNIEWMKKNMLKKL